MCIHKYVYCIHLKFHMQTCHIGLFFFYMLTSQPTPGRWDTGLHLSHGRWFWATAQRIPKFEVLCKPGRGESHLGCLKRPVDEFEILASPGFRKKTLVNNLDGQLPTSTAWCTFFTTINSVWLLLLLQLCRKSSPSCKKPIRNPQRHGTLRCSKATWSFAPALALLERAPWLLADRWGVRLGVKSRQTAFKQGSLNGTDHFWGVSKLDANV